MKTNPYEELLKALQPTKANSDGMTSREIAEALGCCTDSALDRIRAGIKAGKVVVAGKKTFTRIDGVEARVTAYKLASQKLPK